MMQMTLAREVAYTGPAIHTGTVNTLRLRPAAADTGVRFCRVDLKGRPIVAATPRHVTRTDRCTTIGADGAEVSTVEHLLSALRALGVDNVLVEIDGPEVPIADGSALTFVRLIAEAGLTQLGVARKVVAVTEPVWVREGPRALIALPYDGLKVSFTFTNDHGHPALSDLFAEWDVEPDTYSKEIAPARTIGWLAEVQALQERGLAQGARMDMAVVLSESEILTPLRFPDEPVRHKILDVIGDLALVGHLHAHIVAIKSGHALNNRLAREIITKESVAVQ